MQQFLTQLADVGDVRVVILRLPELRMLDASGAQGIGDIVEALEARGITVLLKGPSSEHLRLLGAVGALTKLAHESHLFTDLDDAIAHARAHATRSPTATATAT